MATSVDKCFSEGDFKQITEAVKAAELKTSGEIAHHDRASLQTLAR